MIDRSKIWTGDLNSRALEGTSSEAPSRVGLYDTTLRDGEQTVGVVLDPEAKLSIARALDALGIDRIEAGFPRVSADDAEAIRMIAAAGLDAEIWGFSRAVAADVEALLEVGVKATVIESPVSDGKLSAYGISREKLIERVTGAVSTAVGAGVKVCFFGVDGSRADLGFLQEVYGAAVESGASEVAMVDTLGAVNPEAAALLVRSAREWLGPDVPIHWHGHNDFGLGTAAAIAAVRAGASWVQGTINGMGERAGNASLGEVALALDALYGIETNLRVRQAARDLRARALAVGLLAGSLEAGHRRHALHARERRGGLPIPRPACDRAVLGRAGAAPSGGSCSARRAVSIRSGSSLRNSVWSVRRTNGRRSWARSRRSARQSTGW